MATRAKVGKGLHVRRVTSKEERLRPSVWMSLKTDESFTGYALFEPNPELEDNPGYFEYYTHWDQQARRYVPCAGEACPFCAANDAPKTRAITAWYFPDAEKQDQIKLFEFNYTTTMLLDDEAEDEDGLLGKKLRIKRISDDGDYTIKVRTGADNRPLSASALKKVVAELEEKFNIEQMQEKRMKAELERMRAQDALEDEDDYDEEDEEETPKPKTGRPKAEVETEDEEDEEDEDEEEEEEEIEAEEDEDVEDEDDEEDEEEISGKFVVSRVANEEDGILNLVDADGAKFKMFVAEDLEIDYDEIMKGVEVNLQAQADDEGDWIITEIAVAKPTRRKPTTTVTRRRK